MKQPTEKKISLKDIAQHAGVSTALVSYVLNGKEKEYRVGKEIAIKIKKIAKELNYQPNHVAKSLRSGKTQTIGLIIADISNPFFANIARVVEDEARNNGYTVIIGSSDENTDKSWTLLNVLINKQVDGFIIVSSESSEHQIHYLKEKNIPFILLDRHFPNISTDFVIIDNYKAAFDAGSNLIEGGYHNIGLIAYDSELFHMHERIRGYQDSLKHNNLFIHKDWLQKVNFNNVHNEIKIAIDNMLALDSPINALIFTTYRLAVDGLKYLIERNLKVPDDLAIVSFGQAEVFDLYSCPISYVKQPIDNLGRTAVDLFIKKLKNPKDEMIQIIMEAEIIVRRSSKAKAAIY